MGGLIFLAVVLLLIGVPIVVLIVLYNKLVALRNRFKNAFAQIDVQLNRRYDLIPNLVESAKAYMKHERQTLEAVINARNQAMAARKAAAAHPESGSAIKKLLGAEAALGGAMGSFMALMENYPDLKADNTMINLMEELSSTENKVAFARQAFNDAVMVYNTHREQFPGNLVAGFFRFNAAEMFEIEEPEAKKAVRVVFD